MKKQKWIYSYTLIYLAIIVPTIALLVISGKTFVWGRDGYFQQYTVLRYTGEFIRRLLSGKASMISYSIGQGLDTIGTLAYYGLSDPIQWVAALLPAGMATEIYYHVIIFVYMYLTGLFFGIYTRKVGLGENRTVTAAALIFTFCGYASIGIVKNPYYGNGLMYLPLMLIAVEKIFREQKWQMMVCVTTLILISNFYLAYINTILVVIYILVRLFSGIRERGIAKSAKIGFMLLGSYLLGMLISMFIFLPSVYSFLGSGRVEVEAGYTDSLLYYPLTYYIKLLALFSAPYDYAGFWALQCFCPLCLFTLIALFMKSKDTEDRHQKKVLRICTGLCILFLMIPAAGKVFNGFGYVTNRWSYGYCFAVCAVSAWGLPIILRDGFTGRKRLGMIGLVWAAGMLIYAVICPKLPILSGAGDHTTAAEARIAACAGAAAMIMASLYILLCGKIDYVKRVRVVTLLTAICCMAYFTGYAVFAGSSSSFLSAGIDERISGEMDPLPEDDSFYRVETRGLIDNHALLNDYNGMTYYWSLIPKDITGHYKALEMCGQRWTFKTESMGSDPFIDALAAARYVLNRNNSVHPYGTEAENGVLVNRLALSAGYYFTETMSKDSYEQLDPIGKRIALLRYAVIEGGSEIKPVQDYSSVEYTAEPNDLIQMEENKITAKEGGIVHFDFKADDDELVYLRITGTDMQMKMPELDTELYLKSEAGTQRAYLVNPVSVFNYPQTGVCIYLGTGAENKGSVDLKFGDVLTLTYDSMEVITIPGNIVRSDLEALRSAGSVEVNVNGDRISASVDSDRSGVLQIAVPYSKGWKATVDGAPADIKLSGGMYMGISLDAGSHSIELTYETPGLRAGIAASIAGLCILIVLSVIGAVRKKKGAASNEAV